MPATRTIPAQYLSFSSAGALTLASASGQKMNLNAAKFLFGTSGVDSGALLQIGTNTDTSAGGLVLGTDTFLHRSAGGQIRVGGNLASDAIIGSGLAGAFAEFSNQANFGNGSNYCLLNASDGTTILNAGTGKTLSLKIGNSPGILLDASLRTILSGALRLNHAYIAGVGAATGYLTVQDSTGPTYKVPVLL